MSDFVERVARAIDLEAWSAELEAECDYPAAKRRLEERRSTAIANASAAIAAMREPSEGMIEAGYSNIPSPYDIDVCDSAALGKMFQAMIGAALEEG